MYIFRRSLNQPSFIYFFSFRGQRSDFCLKLLMTLSKEAGMVSNHFYCSKCDNWTNALSRTALCTCWYNFSFLQALTERTVHFCSLELFSSAWCLHWPNLACILSSWSSLISLVQPLMLSSTVFVCLFLFLHPFWF